MLPGSNFNIFLGVKRCVKANEPGHGQQGSVDIQGGSRQRSKHLYLDSPCKDCVATGCLWASLNLGFLRWNPGRVIWIKDQGDDNVAKSLAHAWHTAHRSCHGHVITGSFKILGRRHHTSYRLHYSLSQPRLTHLGRTEKWSFGQI